MRGGGWLRVSESAITSEKSASTSSWYFAPKETKRDAGGMFLAWGSGDAAHLPVRVAEARLGPIRERQPLAAHARAAHARLLRGQRHLPHHRVLFAHSANVLFPRPRFGGGVRALSGAAARRLAAAARRHRAVVTVTVSRRCGTIGCCVCERRKGAMNVCDKDACSKTDRLTTLEPNKHSISYSAYRYSGRLKAKFSAPPSLLSFVFGRKIWKSHVSNEEWYRDTSLVKCPCKSNFRVSFYVCIFTCFQCIF
jgi:hypothetical protein